jgi:hypothetical protein
LARSAPSGGNGSGARHGPPVGRGRAEPGVPTSLIACFKPSPRVSGPCPFASSTQSRGMSQAAQCRKVPPGASGSLYSRTKLRVPSGVPRQCNGGETLSPSDVYRFGISPPWLKGRAGQLQCHAALQQKNTPSPTTTPAPAGGSSKTTLRHWGRLHRVAALWNVPVRVAVRRYCSNERRNSPSRSCANWWSGSRTRMAERPLRGLAAISSPRDHDRSRLGIVETACTTYMVLTASPKKCEQVLEHGRAGGHGCGELR